MKIENRDRHKKNNIHPAIVIQIEGMDVDKCELIFGASSRL